MATNVSSYFLAGPPCMCNAAAPVLAVRSLNFRDVIVNDAADTRTATSGSAICGGSMTRRTSVQAYAADVARHLALFRWHGMPKETWPKRCVVLVAGFPQTSRISSSISKQGGSKTFL